MKYRAEIDGLRALAVFPVILFHAGFDLFSGGFIGVDIFFVISGYLITTILIGEIQADDFSILRFYERRARRILPALFFVLVVSIPFAFWLLLPKALKDYSQSLIGTSLFISNILFWGESGYFDAEAEEKPLLHTWSLAVEEQYYLFFPILLFAVWRFGKNCAFFTVAAITLISFILSEWGWRNYPSANFYLLPFRAWELFVGSICAFFVQRVGTAKNELFAGSGFLLIIFSLFSYDRHTPFPSIYSLAPVLGVAMIILFSERTIVAKFLSFRLLVGIGLVSYSAYLWHQPLFALVRAAHIDKPSTITTISMITLTFALAYLSWRFVEKPFRGGDSIIKTRKTVFLLSALGLVTIALIGAVGHYMDGFRGRIDYKWERYGEHNLADANGRCFGRIAGFCNLEGRRKKIFIIGDSTLYPLAKAIDEIAYEYDVVPIVSAGCIVIKGHDMYDQQTGLKQDHCSAEKFEAVIDFLGQYEEAIVIYGGMFEKVLTGEADFLGEKLEWPFMYLPVDGEGNSLDLVIRESINDIASKAGSVYLFQLPEFGYDVQKAMHLSSIYGKDAFSSKLISSFVAKDSLRSKHVESLELLDSLYKEEPNIFLLDTYTPLCSPGFNGMCSSVVNEQPMLIDRIHPTRKYASDIASIFLKTL